MIYTWELKVLMRYGFEISSGTAALSGAIFHFFCFLDTGRSKQRICRMALLPAQWKRRPALFVFWSSHRFFCFSVFHKSPAFRKRKKKISPFLPKNRSPASYFMPNMGHNIWCVCHGCFVWRPLERCQGDERIGQH